ncbi:hypothetical protein CHCC4186_1709 [Bacillus paralicheniformis]|nr:hypothetical protein CHCC4186_1709 [Bacillus paralicheniformis]
MTFHLGHFLYDGYSCSMKYIPFIIQQAAKDHKLPQKKPERSFLERSGFSLDIRAASAFKLIHLVFDLL